INAVPQKATAKRYQACQRRLAYRRCLSWRIDVPQSFLASVHVRLYVASGRCNSFRTRARKLRLGSSMLRPKTLLVFHVILALTLVRVEGTAAQQLAFQELVDAFCDYPLH